ncbi:hypothetical protein HUU39_20365 [candidate division KSB1 bacterium]|nr:hypothetical protein [bacterium]NUM67587.1 hypothetical protein [candidate division KSB1 bacterium]
MTLQLKPLTEITHTAIQVLCKEIGVVNTIRFINQFSTGHGNYTEERRQLFGELSLDNIVAEIKQMRKPEPS